MGRMGLLIVRISLFVFCCLAGIYLGSEFISSSYASLWGGISGGLIVAGATYPIRDLPQGAQPAFAAGFLYDELVGEHALEATSP